MDQCRPDLFNKQTEQQAINHIFRKSYRACENPTSHTPWTECGLLICVHSFPDERIEHPCEWQLVVTSADRQQSGNDPRLMSLRKMILSFGAIISKTFFRNRRNTPTGSTPHTYQDRKADAGGQKFGRPKNWQTAHDTAYCQTESSGVILSQHKAPLNNLGHFESRKSRYHTKDRAFQCLLPLM